MRNENPPAANRSHRFPSLVAFACLLLLSCFSAAVAQSISFQRERGRDMLKTIKSDIQKNYYDSAFHGVDVDARFKEADELIKKADSGGQIMGIIARTLLYFDDSHLFFVPPARSSRIDYGWQMAAIGDRCYITAVEPGSDAEAKGLKPGDEVLSIDGMNPKRESLWMIQYLYHALRPQNGAHLVLQSSNGQPREVDANARVTPGRRVTDLTNYDEYSRFIMNEERDARLRRHRFIEIGDVLVWKMPEFDLPKVKVDEVMNKAKDKKAIVLDLRGNPGGYEETLLRMIGNVFDHDVKVGDLTRRKEQKPMLAPTRGNGVFSGQLFVLIDSESASSAEIFARAVQLEKRGVVIGDRSAGAVMRAREIGHSEGVDTVIFYGVSVTDADVVMSDGKSLEKNGVIPDQVVLPSGADLAAGRDPALSLALTLAGKKIEPDKAGALFPTEWRR